MSRRRSLTAALLLWTTTALASCGWVNDRQSSSELSESAVGIVADGCSLIAQLGSGVVLDKPGQIVTAAHPIKGATTITVIDSVGIEHESTVVAFDKDSDLAILDAPTVSAAPLPLGDPVIGAGNLLVWSRDEGTTAMPIQIVKKLQITIEDIYIEEVAQRGGMEIAGDVQIGDSGGAVVNDAGDVVGIVYASSRERGGIGFATNSTEIRNLLASRSDQPVANGHCT